MPYKSSQPAKRTISPTNEADLLLDKGEMLASWVYAPLNILISQVLDQIADGRDMYMIIGATSNKSSFVVTVKDAGAPTSYYGVSLEDLNMALENAL